MKAVSGKVSLLSTLPPGLRTHYGQRNSERRGESCGKGTKSARQIRVDNSAPGTVASQGSMGILGSLGTCQPGQTRLSHIHGVCIQFVSVSILTWFIWVRVYSCMGWVSAGTAIPPRPRQTRRFPYSAQSSCSRPPPAEQAKALIERGRPVEAINVH